MALLFKRELWGMKVKKIENIGKLKDRKGCTKYKKQPDNTLVSFKDILKEAEKKINNKR